MSLNIPVSEVAKSFGVSRMTIYTWFTGAGVPHKDKIVLIEKFLKK
jgi:predicted DNA-binding transcriptional regulator AlpA